ncbi:OmpA family protein [Pseudaestuariivita rosea]|uniref:OmpA family protein n=1 Tax=Pseudaestuariivita rosea TaxID=2763263 RepID=UPI001ABB47E9|nr:OmpA family protein [Pseudaestuariivita rosea]
MIKRKSLALAAMASLIFLGACMDTSSPSASDDPNRNTKQGALIGGLVGAGIGVAVGDDADERRRGAVIGGLVGAGSGALIGRQLDKQAAELRQDFNNGAIDVVNTGEQLIVTMPQDILFDFDSTAVRSSLRRDLGVLADSLNRYPNSNVIVIGHTDNVGSASYNQDLSERRARAVSSVLINNGVRGGRLRSIGRGEDQPVASNLTPEGRQQNRRVEIVIQPTGQ